MTKSILRAIEQRNASIAFKHPSFDTLALYDALRASMGILRQAQTDCLDRPIAPDEIAEATAFLIEKNGRAEYHCDQFRKGLDLRDQWQRFEKTAQALHQLEKLFPSAADPVEDSGKADPADQGGD